MRNGFDCGNELTSHSGANDEDLAFRESSTERCFPVHQPEHDLAIPEAAAFPEPSTVMEGLMRPFVEGQGISIDIDATSFEPILMLSGEDVMTRRALASE
jgi:hypothetical protein